MTHDDPTQSLPSGPQRPNWPVRPDGAALAQPSVRKGAPWWLFILAVTVLPFGACAAGFGIGSAGDGDTAAAVDAPTLPGEPSTAPVAEPTQPPEPTPPAATTQQAVPTEAATTADGSAPAEAAPAAGPGVGTPVTDGEFTFVVTGVERPGNTIGEDPFTETAQGEFVVVRVDVTNSGTEARTLSSSDQYLFDDQGRKFEASTAIFALEDADKTFLEEINPGNVVTGAPLLFDVPAGVVLDRIELHDVFYSPGVSVSLR